MERSRGSVSGVLVGAGVAVGAALALSACGHPAGPGAPSMTSAPMTVSCLDLDGNGRPRWVGGPPSTQAAGVASALQEVGNAYPDEVAGVALCSDGSGADIYLAPDQGSARAKAVELAGQHPGAVHLVEVPHSLAEQLTAMDAVRPLMDEEPRITGMGPEPWTGGLAIRVVPVSGTLEDIEAQRGPDVADVRARIVAAIGPGLPLRFERGDGAGVLL